MSCTSNGGYQLQCNWTAPHTYIDITQYTVDVTVVTQCGEQIIHTLCSIIDTQFTYVTGPGTYSVSVVAMIGDLPGVASITEVTIKQCNEGVCINKMMTATTQYNYTDIIFRNVILNQFSDYNYH